ncbi:MAG: TonB-dependent receptor [Bacteroidales bacterium]|nr:TonB-dependent receptor [Bacteroidales bacterium]
MYLRRTTYYGVFLCLFLPSVLHGQEADSSKYKQLKAFPLQDKKIIETPKSAPVRTVPAEQIERLPAKDLGDALKYVAGAQVKDYGGLGGIKTVSIRSLGASHTGVFYDFLPVSDGHSGQTNLGMFSRDNGKELQLFSGSPDDIFHPARMLASAATLQITSAPPVFQKGERLHGNIGFRTGSFHLYHPFLRMDHRLGEHLSSSLSVEYLNQKGDYPFEYRNHDAVVREIRKNAALQHFRTEGNLFYQNKERLATAKLFYFRSSQELPGAIVYYNPVCNQRMEEEILMGQLHYHNHKLFRTGERWKFQSNAKAYYSMLEYIDPDYLNAAHLLDNTYRQWEYLLSNTLLRRFGPHFALSLANDETLNHMNCNLANFEPPTRIASLTALSGKYETCLKKDTNCKSISGFSATFALLHNAYHDFASGSQTGVTRKWSPSANLLFSLASARHKGNILSLRMGYKDIFRMPSFSENYYRFFNDRLLLPEDVQEGNIGLQCQWEDRHGRNTRGGVDAFYNKVTNKIVAVPNQNLFVWTMINYGQVAVYGAEGQWQWSDMETLARWHLQWNAQLNYTFQRALDLSDPESKTYRHQIPYTPVHSGSCILGLRSLRRHHTQVMYTLLWVGPRYTLGQNIPDNRMDAYTDHGLSVAHILHFTKTRCELQIDLLNLADRHYEVIRNYPMPGRQLQAKLNFHF